MPESEVAKLVRLQKEALLLHEAEELRILTQRWLLVERALEAEILKTALALKEEGITGEEAILRDERFKRLLWQARAEHAKFAAEFDERAKLMQEYGLTQGLEDAGQVLKMALDEAQTALSFEMLNVEAINAMIGLTADGTPLQTLLMREYGAAVNGMLEALLRGIGLGLSPQKIAEDMVKAFGISLQKALLIARTEMLRAYRLATQEQYRASDVVMQYKRLAVKDDRTCLGCLIQDGETFETTDEFAEHPNGRCTLVPVVRGANAITWETGKEWLAGLSEERQRGIMGDARYELWKSGAISLDDLATLKENETWGGAWVPTPLNVLRG